MAAMVWLTDLRLAPYAGRHVKEVRDIGVQMDSAFRLGVVKAERVQGEVSICQTSVGTIKCIPFIYLGGSMKSSK